MIELLQSLFYAIEGFFGFFNSIKDWLTGMIDLGKNSIAAVQGVLSSLSAFPAFVITGSITMLTLCIIFRVLGR